MSSSPSARTAGQIELSDSIGRKLPPWLRWSVEPFSHLLGLNQLNRVIEASEAEGAPEGFFRRVLNAMGLAWRVTGNRDIPESGSLVIVANHPFGAPEAIALADYLQARRPDLRIMANHLLTRFPALDPWLIPVDPFGFRASAGRNLGPLKHALRHLRQGGALLVFPAGEVSAFHPGHRMVEDKAWTPHLGTLVRAARATVLPVFFPGRNSEIFQTLGLVHPLFRTALLPREFLRWQGKELEMRVGKAIPPEKWEGIGDNAALVAHLRLRVELLGQPEPRARRMPARLPLPGHLAVPGWRRARKPEGGPETIASPEDPAALAAEVAALPEDTLLGSQGGLEVRVAAAGQIPRLLLEIGRLREEAFRAVGEGSGKARDLDAFDMTYRHLFLWNPAAREVAGAYRLGLTDEILARSGSRGLYTSTLFRFTPGFPRRLGPAIELGRSFVCPAYQKKPHSLFLLWKGIAGFAARHPRYRVLFGPVSISNDYRPVSKNLLVQFLRQKHGDRRLGPMVGARHPFLPARYFRSHRRRLAEGLGSIEAVSAVIADLEDDGKGVPVLIRQYLRMNAVLLKFNIDPDFSEVIDGLMVVDLATTDPKLLGRYMGEAALREFLAHHGKAGAAVRPEG